MIEETTHRGEDPEPPQTDGVALRGVIGASEGKWFPLTPGPNVVGRAEDSDVRLTDSGVSRNHAELSLRPDGRVVLFDLGSTNGTFVLGRRIDDETEVGVGSLIGFGPDAVLQLVPAPAGPGAGAPSLTQRELEVAQGVARGLTNEEIARELGISRRTVDRHLANAFARLGIRSRVELARYVLTGR
ncbi:MAG: FHA domain-containing protein [Myxococcales bacterium]|nr:FHA domain-containing protein [Myxococcales bacterium]